MKYKKHMETENKKSERHIQVNGPSKLVCDRSLGVGAIRAFVYFSSTTSKRYFAQRQLDRVCLCGHSDFFSER
eukprot:m.349691 g.349691  ORF g.349691 m.349691 type:complete len:73 (-) comp16577_c0_seq2:137-355(-)